MNIFKAVRAPEWWEYKLPPVLAVAYATVMFSDEPLWQVAPYCLCYLGALVIGAIYVSLINDLTDIEADLAIGKKNRMAAIEPRWRWLAPVICLAIGVLFGFLMWPDYLSVCLYAMAWLVFSLYSIPPFRFKNRGILGVLCDASGAHLFPSLLMVSGLSFLTDQPVNWYWFAAVGVWSLAYGLRGILWHQFLDRENDIKTGIHTFASRIKPVRFIPVARAIIGVEITSFLVMLLLVNHPLMIVMLLLYAILVFIRYKRYQHRLIIIISPENQPFQVLMLEYYQLFFPIGLLLVATCEQSYGWLVLLAHMLLFPQKAAVAAKDYIKVFLR